jgi:eukaryotic-like serine/threonine-protein kinase
MLVGQQLGPFLIEREIGSGAMGAVYRGKYVKTGQVVAVKVMAPGLGETNINAVARFEREAAILKQLNHPNIVRLFGIGKHHGTRFYAMEYVVGESLDKVMARRGRMTWEEVVTLGQQLCAALQHAHEAGIVHRDLKPSNLMILPDGTLKLTDFGIAKDLDVTAITEANCTVGTASYMSPEQCKGERNLSLKSDLYSMGIVFYELITGRKPFNAENAMDMFMQHVQGTFERPSRIVFDMPVWLDTLVSQLMEKKPEQRPMNAATVLAALGSIKEKVEAMQSAGVDAVRSRMIDRPRGARHADEEDKEAARLLMTGRGKRKGKRKKQAKPIYLQVWFQAIGLGTLLAGAVTAIIIAVQPPSAKSLYERAETLMKSKNPEDHQKALDGPIKDYQTYYNDSKGEAQDRKDQVEEWKRQCEVEQCEEVLGHLLTNKFAKPNNDAEKAAQRAALAEEAGDVVDAREKWRMVESLGFQAWGRVAANRLKDLNEMDELEKATTAAVAQPPDKAPELTGLDKKVFDGVRLEKDEPAKAKDAFDSLQKETAGDRDKRKWFLLAAKKVRELAERLKPEKKP